MAITWLGTALPPVLPHGTSPILPPLLPSTHVQCHARRYAYVDKVYDSSVGILTKPLSIDSSVNLFLAIA